MENRHEVETPVRMILWDYDAAPDGEGTYVVVDAQFPSLVAAFRHRNSVHGGYLCWGHIESLDGKVICNLPAEHDEDVDYNPYEDYDEY